VFSSFYLGHGIVCPFLIDSLELYLQTCRIRYIYHHNLQFIHNFWLISIRPIGFRIFSNLLNLSIYDEMYS
jgi:hypothetical protein